MNMISCIYVYSSVCVSRLGQLQDNFGTLELIKVYGWDFGFSVCMCYALVTVGPRFMEGRRSEIRLNTVNSEVK